MEINTGIFSGGNGLLRLFTLVVGGIDTGLITDPYNRLVDQEVYLLIMVLFMLMLTIVLKVPAFLGCPLTLRGFSIQQSDFVVNVLGRCVLLVAGILMTVSGISHKDEYSTLKFQERILAGVIGIINSIVHIYVGLSDCMGRWEATNIPYSSGIPDV